MDQRKYKLIVVCFIILSLYFITAIYYYNADIYNSIKDWPFNTFLFHPGGKFGDFYSNYNNLNNIEYEKTYYLRLDLLPLFNLIHILFAKIKNPESAHHLYILSPILLSFILYFSQLKNFLDTKLESSFYTFILFFFSYPVLFVIDRSNAEIYCFLLCSLFIFSFNNKPKLSVVFYSLALLIKPFPIVFLPLFFSKNKFYLLKYLLLIYPIFMFFLYLITISIVDGDLINLLQNNSGYSGYTKEFVLKNLGLGYGHSFFGALKIFGYGAKISDIAYKLYTPYFFIAATIYIIVATLSFGLEKYWEKITVLTVTMCLLPYVSADYKLLHFLAPIVLFITEKKDHNYLFPLIVISLLLATKPHFPLDFINPSLVDVAVGWLVLLSPFLMFVLLFSVLIRIDKVRLIDSLKDFFIYLKKSAIK
jgi:hypothetical protein